PATECDAPSQTFDNLRIPRRVGRLSYSAAMRFKIGAIVTFVAIATGAGGQTPDPIGHAACAAGPIRRRWWRSLPTSSHLSQSSGYASLFAFGGAVDQLQRSA